MAAANLNTNKLTAEFNNIKVGTFTTLDGSDGGVFNVTNADAETLILIQNTDSSNAETVTIKAPTNPCMGAGSGFPDKAVSVAKSSIAACMIESARYMNADGTIKITGSADVKVLVVQM